MTTGAVDMTNDQLIEVIRKAKTRKEIVDQFPGNTLTAYKRLQRFCERYNIDVSHLSRAPSKIRAGRSIQTLDSILVENSTYLNRASLKRRMINTGLLENQCACGQGPEWNGRPLTLQLDHINGVANDNRLSNLRMICPNCHSQTDNYAGKNSIRK